MVTGLPPRAPHPGSLGGHPQTPGDPMPRVRLHPHGLDLGDRILPLRGGSMHYWRHDPAEWGAGLDGIVSLGLHLVDVYVPWGVHEIAPGLFDFGERKAQLDVVRFATLAHD